MNTDLFFPAVFGLGILGMLAESYYATLANQGYFRRGLRLLTLTRAAGADLSSVLATPLRDAHPLVKLKVHQLSELDWALFTVSGWFSRGNVSTIRARLTLDDARTRVSLVVYLNYWVIAWPPALVLLGGDEGRGILIAVLCFAVAQGVIQFFRFLGVLRRASL